MLNWMCFVTYYRSKYAKINTEIFVFCYLEIICKKNIFTYWFFYMLPKFLNVNFVKIWRNITLGILKKKKNQTWQETVNNCTWKWLEKGIKLLFLARIDISVRFIDVFCVENGCLDSIQVIQWSSEVLVKAIVCIFYN